MIKFLYILVTLTRSYISKQKGLFFNECTVMILLLLSVFTQPAKYSTVTLPQAGTTPESNLFGYVKHVFTGQLFFLPPIQY